MSEENTVAEPTTEPTPPVDQGEPTPEKTPSQTTPNMKFANKYAITDMVWVIFTNGPLLRVNQFEVKSLNFEVIGFDEPLYIYGFTIAADGHGDAANLTHVKESMCFFNRDEAEAEAQKLVGDLIGQYDKGLEIEKAKYEAIVNNLTEQRSQINANELRVPDRVVVAPEDPVEKARGIADEANKIADDIENGENPLDDTPADNADPVTPEKSPETDTPNPESDGNQPQTEATPS